jgi:hypothetical protein
MSGPMTPGGPLGDKRDRAIHDLMVDSRVVRA